MQHHPLQRLTLGSASPRELGAESVEVQRTSFFRPLHEWNGPPGALVVWRPTTDAWTAVREAPSSPVPPSHEQEQHLRAYRACERQQSEMARLLIVTWQEPGLCDVRTMTEVLNAYLQHHDTYQSWFQEQDGVIQRRLVHEPGALRLEAVLIWASPAPTSGRRTSRRHPRRSTGIVSASGSFSAPIRSPASRASITSTLMDRW